MIVNKTVCDMCGADEGTGRKPGWIEILSIRDEGSISVGVCVDTPNKVTMVVLENHKRLDFCSLACVTMWFTSLFKEKEANK